jgi:hypothetical protein
MSYIPQKAAIYTSINYEKTNGNFGKKDLKREKIHVLYKTATFEKYLKAQKRKEKKIF